MQPGNHLYQRYLGPKILEAMEDTPVVFIGGPRQAGKTTLARQLPHAEGEYLTLDDSTTRLSAQEDPWGLIREKKTLIIDEVQRAPQLILAIKKAVDEDRQPGRFLLTGSASLLVLPSLSDSLAGRIESFSLLPLSQSEILGKPGSWIDSVFVGNIPKVRNPKIGSDLIELILTGGFPEALTREKPDRKRAWAHQYINSLVQRDVRDIAEVYHIAQISNLLRALAYTVALPVNYSSLGSSLGLDHKTTSRYIGILEQTYLVRRIEPYYSNKLNRIVKSPKVQFIDSGLLSSLLEASKDSLTKNRTQFGPILETFVYSELEKHLTWSSRSYRIMYFRDHLGREVDFLIEDALGNLVAIEVKASATIRTDDLKNLHYLQEKLGSKLIRSLVLYDGIDTLPVSPGITALPLSSFWGEISG